MLKLFGINGIWFVMLVVEVMIVIIVFMMNCMKYFVLLNMVGEKEVI